MQRKLSLVLGGAECVWADLRSAPTLCPSDVIVAVNDIGVDWPGPLDHWVSYHSDRLSRWAAARAKKGLPPAGNYWVGKGGPTPSAPKGCKFVEVWGGSSGLLATTVALNHSEKVILCGVPIDPGMRHYHDGQQGKPWKEASKYHKHWLDAEPKLRDRVKSMSGWTADLLGRPTKEWLES